MEQLALDLFPCDLDDGYDDPEYMDPYEGLTWEERANLGNELLLRERGCGDDLIALYHELVAIHGIWSAFERAKTFELVVRYGFTIGELIGIIGIKDEPDHHVCWDRKWAYIQNVPKEELPSITKWDYSTIRLQMENQRKPENRYEEV